MMSRGLWDPRPPLSGEAFVPTVGQQHLMSAAAVSQAEAHYVQLAEAVASYIPPRAPIGCEQASGDTAMRPFVVNEASDDAQEDEEEEEEDEVELSQREEEDEYADDDDDDIDRDDHDDEEEDDDHEDGDDYEIYPTPPERNDDFAFLHNLAQPAANPPPQVPTPTLAQLRFDHAQLLNRMVAAFAAAAPVQQRLRELAAAASAGVAGMDDSAMGDPGEQDPEQDDEERR
jgi:hypothetical protein